jgi:uncharacterized protein YggU (UPF0235/DUF167 family)
MKITVVAKPNSKKESVEITEDGRYTIRVGAQPEDGKANQRIIELLADFLKVPKSKINLVYGHKGKIKIFNID